MLIANYLINISPTRANFRITFDEKFIGTRSNIYYLKVFGCLAYVHDPKESRKKLNSQTKHCLFLDYNDESKAYRLYDPCKHKVVLSRDVVFDETKVNYKHLFHKQTLDPPNFEFGKSSPQLSKLPSNTNIDTYDFSSFANLEWSSFDSSDISKPLE